MFDELGDVLCSYFGAILKSEDVKAQYDDKKIKPTRLLEVYYLLLLIRSLHMGNQDRFTLMDLNFVLQHLQMIQMGQKVNTMLNTLRISWYKKIYLIVFGWKLHE